MNALFSSRRVRDGVLRRPGAGTAKDDVKAEFQGIVFVGSTDGKAESATSSGSPLTRLSARKGIRRPPLPLERVLERIPVTIEKRITRIPKPFWQLYVPEEVIHDGGEQCRIKRVRSTTDGKTYVVKVQLKSKLRGRNEALFRRITERMMNLPDSPNVIKIFACYEDDKYFYTLLESLQGGDLLDFFRVLTSDSLDPEFVEKEVRKIIGSLLESLHYLHSQGLIHKDVKLENIVFKEKGDSTKATPESSQIPKTKVSGGSSPVDPVSPTGMRLIDFDFLEEWEPSSPKSKAVLGTDGYIAPEAYLGDACPKSDVFSTGVVMYLLIARRFPFDDATFDDGPNENYVGSPKMAEIHARLGRAEVRFGRSFDPYPEAKDLCMSMLEFNANNRPDAAEALRHPWFRGREATAAAA
jgi:serine/threonine protein kinase